MKRMLFNATHAEETRVAIVEGQKLVDIDIEVAGHESRKSNIYKGVITRIEPSLEACFVDYGDVKHGFLSFKEVGRQYFKDGVAPSSAKIQEALHVGQELLVQMEKEERGNKGAALTSFISLAGRYMVLMPNNPRGGGVSRRIDGEDRAELRALMDQLNIPEGMGVIARTAAIDRTLEELQWDLNYLLQLWKAIDGASQTKGAFLIYQESSLIIRAIRDYFSADVKQILIDTDDVYEQAKQFVGYVMPDMAERVVRYSEDVPLFTRFQIEHQIETAHSRTVPLPSGGSIVIDHTEALVAIDVNSARSTRGGDIEETATRTNLEAAEEAARQLRLRDLGGLVVIDFIDMEDSKNQRAVEAKLKDGLRHDRARLQMGKISRFGLMELSRQRLRPSLAEGSHTACPRCNGIGSIRDVNSTALHILRLVQEEAMKDGTAAVHVQVPVDVATFLLNEKRLDLAKLETKLNVSVVLIPNRHIETPNFKLDRLKHEDARLDNPKPTYEMADAPEELDLNKSKSQAKAPQVAKVTGITPPERAPLVERPERPAHNPQTARGAAAPVAGIAAPKLGLWGKIKSFFGAGDSNTAANTSVRAANEAKNAAAGVVNNPAGTGERKDRNDRGERSAGNGRSDRGGRGRNDRNERGDRAERPPREAREPRDPNAPRPERADRAERAERPPREPRENREPRDLREPRDPNAPRPERAPRPARENREPREPRVDSALASDNAVQGPTAEQAIHTAPDTATPTVQPIREGREARAERNEQRRGRNPANAAPADANANGMGASGSSNTHHTGDNPQEPLVFELPATHLDGSEGGEHKARGERGGRNRRGPRNRGERTERSAADGDNQPSHSAGIAAVGSTEAAPVTAPATATATGAGVITHTAAVGTPVVAAPVAAPQAKPTPVAAIVPAKLDEAPLQQLSQTVGLEWVNTDNAAFAAAQAKLLNQPKPARAVRERPARATVADEPLQMMETGKPA
jgi:ribonuclease E